MTDCGSLEKSSRCLLCSSTGHRKKDCPTVKPKEGNGGQKSEKKIAKVHDSKGQKGSERTPRRLTQDPRKKRINQQRNQLKLQGRSRKVTLSEGWSRI